VPPDSSTLDHPGQRARTIEADHIGMVKFSGKNDKAYEMVKEDIEELVTRAEEAIRNLKSGMQFSALKAANYLIVKRSSKRAERGGME
jgi:hypothetical protein